MADSSPPYWVLLSVLFNSQPLNPSLAMTLHQAALDLYQRDDTVAPVAGDMLSGTVRNLKKHMMLGTIGGPAFEADIETERGRGQVRFLLTREGLEMLHASREKPRYLN